MRLKKSTSSFVQHSARSLASSVRATALRLCPSSGHRSGIVWVSAMASAGESAPQAGPTPPPGRAWRAVHYALGSRETPPTLQRGGGGTPSPASARGKAPTPTPTPTPSAGVSAQEFDSALAMSACAIRCVSRQRRARAVGYADARASAGHARAQALAEHSSELEARLHATRAELAACRRGASASSEDTASLTAQLRAAKARPLGDPCLTVLTHGCSG